VHFRHSGRLQLSFSIICAVCSGCDTLLPLRVSDDLIIVVPNITRTCQSVEVCVICFVGLRKISDFHFSGIWEFSGFRPLIIRQKHRARV